MEAGVAEPSGRPLLPGPAWDALSSEIVHCTKCHLAATRSHAVVFRGSVTPRVVFVGEAPGAAEDREGLPFVGRSGKLLDAAVERIGLRPSEYGVLNLIKCRPPRNRFDELAARTCRPYLDRQFALLRPSCVVTLGARAFHALTPSRDPVLEVAGQVQPGTRPPIFPLIHPAAAMRSRRLAERWKHDVDALGRWLGRAPAQPV